MKVLRWLWNHWYVPVLFIVGVIGYVFGTRQNSSELVDAKMEAIDAKEKQRLAEIDKAAEIANARADAEYQETISALDDKARAKSDALRGNPAKRIRYLRKLSKRLGK